MSIDLYATVTEGLQNLQARPRPSIVRGFTGRIDYLTTEFEINTPLRRAHFAAQITEETDGLRTLQEYASGREYEGRADLGNTQPGDGARFKGRGYIMLTGRFNYKAYGETLDLPLLTDPESACESTGTALEIAALYWENNNLNALADEDAIRMITKRINGGYNGLITRQKYLTFYKTVFGA